MAAHVGIRSPEIFPPRPMPRRAALGGRRHSPRSLAALPAKVGFRFPPLLQSSFQNTFSVVASPSRSVAVRHVFLAQLGTSIAIPSPGARLSPGFSLRTSGLARFSLQAPGGPHGFTLLGQIKPDAWPGLR
jgi:hypothetical protein